MPRKRYKPEEIVAKLRQVDVVVSQGQVMADAIRQIGLSEVTYYLAPRIWRTEIEPVERLKERCANQRLRRPQQKFGLPLEHHGCVSTPHIGTPEMAPRSRTGQRPKPDQHVTTQ